MDKSKQEKAELAKAYAALLKGQVSNVTYNFGTGQSEPKPPFGWGQ